jgi:APA family basic amino acid/polyamine antiporter
MNPVKPARADSPEPQGSRPGPGALTGNLSTYGLTMVAIGACIGSGIFLSPSFVAGYLHSPGWILVAWGLGFLHSLTGSLSFSELGAMFPRAGGQYVYLKEGYGALVAFLYAWVTFVVINGSAIAALSLTFARYLNFIIPIGKLGILGAAALAILLMATVNLVRTAYSDLSAKVFTALKLAGLAMIIGVGLALGSPDRLRSPLAPSEAAGTASALGLAGAFGLAFVGVYFSVGGWQHASYLAGEAREPRLTVPRAMVLGAIVVGAVYWLTNLAYLLLLPVDKIAASSCVAADAVETVLPGGGVLISVMIVLAALGSVGVCLYSVPRIFFALAADGLFFRSFTVVHPRFKTPANSIMLQAAWAVILLFFWGTFANIITYLVFMDGLFMLLVGAAVMILRRKRSDLDRPYKTLGYPLTPVVFVLITLYFLLATLIHKPVQAYAAIVCMLLGLPFYFYFRGKGRHARTPPPLRP